MQHMGCFQYIIPRFRWRLGACYVLNRRGGGCRCGSRSMGHGGCGGVER